jgi:hypothetical protein
MLGGVLNMMMMMMHDDDDDDDDDEYLCFSWLCWLFIPSTPHHVLSIFPFCI